MGCQLVLSRIFSFGANATRLHQSVRSSGPRNQFLLCLDGAVAPCCVCAVWPGLVWSAAMKDVPGQRSHSQLPLFRVVVLLWARFKCCRARLLWRAASLFMPMDTASLMAATTSRSRARSWALHDTTPASAVLQAPQALNCCCFLLHRLSGYTIHSTGLRLNRRHATLCVPLQRNCCSSCLSIMSVSGHMGELPSCWQGLWNMKIPKGE
jgi:hypothetical protein